MKKAILLILFSLITNLSLFAQHSNFAFHILNPTAIYNKAGFKIEFKSEKIGFAFFGTNYYGNFPKYLGIQAGFELRYYIGHDTVKRNQTFLYTKVLGGHQEQQERIGESFFSEYVREGDYSGVGIGFGRHYNKRNFFIEINAGLKYCNCTPKQVSGFYAYGPASYIDLHFNIGFQIDNRPLNRWYTDSNTPK